MLFIIQNPLIIRIESWFTGLHTPGASYLPVRAELALERQLAIGSDCPCILLSLLLFVAGDHGAYQVFLVDQTFHGNTSQMENNQK